MTGSAQDLVKKISENLSGIKTKVAVMSGKGGVGKSTVTSLLAVCLARKGKSTGIFDCDFTGSSIPKIFGLESETPVIDDDMVYPVSSRKFCIKIMSIHFFLPEKNAPLIWRGPLISKTMLDLLSKTEWGDLDYLLFDLPPGTSDVPLTLLQVVRPDKIVIVSTPQKLATDIVEKAINMARMLNAEVTCLVENMSLYECPNCGYKSYLFGKSKARELSERYNIPHFLEIPLDPKFSELCDEGRIEDCENIDFSNSF